MLEALRAAGAAAELLAWDDPAAPAPGDFDSILLRSTWNYFLEPEKFLAWAEGAAAASSLRNSLPAVRWNLHKRYLLELEAAGIPIVPTVVIARGAAPDLEELCRRRSWEDVVIKPAVSAASFRTQSFRADQRPAGQAFLKSLCSHRDALVQPFIPGFVQPGERAQVWIAGEHAHCVRKQPRFAGQEEQVSGGLAPEPAERELFQRVLDALPEAVRPDLLYARLDLVPGPADRLLVSELELIEPSLFLIQHPPALARLVSALLRPG